MTSRWCVIAGPRSGSTWLEEMILRSIQINGTTCRLSEFMNPGLSSVLKQDWFLDYQRNFVKKVNTRRDINNQEFFNTRSQLLFDNNLNQSWIMRLFCQPHLFPWFDYLRFIQELATKNVNFVCLKRSLFDRTISWYFMNNTGIVHKHKKKESNVFYSRTVGDVITVEKLKLSPVEINLSVWEKIFIDRIAEDRCLNNIINNFNFPVVNYENLLDDCKKNNIPIDNSENTIMKLYEERYQDCILNYSDLIKRYHEILEKLDLNAATFEHRDDIVNKKEK